MRKIMLSVFGILIIIISVTIIYFPKEKEVNQNKEEKSSSFISMMLENDEGNYVESTDLKFPINGYVFNAEKSGCENGGTLFWNAEKQKIEASLLTSDKCYAYFNKDEIGSICRNKNLTECFTQNYKKDGSIIYHDGLPDYEGRANVDQETGDLSYRYTGINEEINNYVCLDGTTISGACTSDDDLYRIIGLFKNSSDQYEAKLIKATFATTTELGDANAEANEDDKIPSAYASGREYYWNTSLGIDENANNINMWKESNLNKVNLNSFYYNYIINKVKGLAKYITNHTWEIGGFSSDGNVQMVFNQEIGINKVKETDAKCYSKENPNVSRVCNESNDLKYQSNIGLMYISDYMYGTLPEYWTITAYNFGVEDTTTHNWMFMGQYEWTITRTARNNSFSTGIGYAGNVNDGYKIYIKRGIRPCFYLSTTITLASGSGTHENPFRLNFSK